MRNAIALLCAGSTLVPVLAHPWSSSKVTARQLNPSAPSVSSSVIVQLFEWSWNSVAAECQSFIGPAGYKLVQVSPATEHIQGSQWWTSYQKVSAQIQSKRGSRQEFADMVTACNNAGVEVIVDTVWNHMAGIDGGTGVAGTSFSHYQYANLYSPADFHYCGTQDDAILDWNNKTQIQYCQLSNLADLNTESDYVKQTLVDNGNDLLSLGVSGFRLDAGKHVPVAELEEIVSRLSRKPSYITSEVVGDGAPIPPSDYVPLGAVTVTKSYEAIQNAFTGSTSLSSLNGYESGNNVPSDSATVFVATHDSERGNVGGSLNYNSPSNTYTLAHVFLLAYPYGTPSVLSSYQFSTTDDGAPNGGYGTCSGSSGTNGFLCQHRWTAVANMVAFRTAVSGTSLVHFQTGSSQQIAFGRGSLGFVAINNADQTWSGKALTTQLAAGTYCDVVSGSKQNGACTGASVTVGSDGKVNVNLAGRSAFAIYTASKL